MVEAKKTLRRIGTAFLTGILTATLAAPVWAAPHGRKGGALGGTGAARVDVKLRLRLRDLDEAPWALRHIAAMDLLSVIRGYEDGTFRPNQPVTEAEAVAMVVRAMGYENEAARPLPAALGRQRLEGWYAGYAEVAADLGLLDSDEFHPQLPAQRAWVAKLMVRAMGLEDKADAAEARNLDFRDAAAIPDELGGYVAVVVAEDVMRGYPDFTFRPFAPVTRAEMAAILDRAADRLRQADGGDRVVEGRLVAVEEDGAVVVVVDGKEARYRLADGVLVFLDDRQAEVGDLDPGDSVRLYVGADGAVVFIDAWSTGAGGKENKNEDENQNKDKDEVRWVSGEVYAVDVNDRELTLSLDGDEERYEVAADVRVTYGDEDLEWGDVRVGDRVRVALDADDTVTAIEIRSRESSEVEGRLVEVDASGDGHVTVRVDGAEWTWRVSRDVEVRIDGRVRSLDALRKNDEVRLTLEGGWVVRIEVED
ncbi:MAG: S-layer homology domain-containing protein [Clostridia bacterium]|nr:S-layer homology domain-containing protein [Clostridia bacterium]